MTERMIASRTYRFLASPVPGWSGMAYGTYAIRSSAERPVSEFRSRAWSARPVVSDHSRPSSGDERCREGSSGPGSLVGCLGGSSSGDPSGWSPGRMGFPASSSLPGGTSGTDVDRVRSCPTGRGVVQPRSRSMEQWGDRARVRADSRVPRVSSTCPAGHPRSTSESSNAVFPAVVRRAPRRLRISSAVVSASYPQSTGVER
jgi:hypothetical protein